MNVQGMEGLLPPREQTHLNCWFLLPSHLGQLIPARGCQLSSSLAKLLCFEILHQATSPNDVSQGERPASPPLSQDDVQGEMHTVCAQETSGWSAGPQAGLWLFYKLGEQNRMGRHGASVITQPQQQVTSWKEMWGNGLPGRPSPGTRHHCHTVTFPSL